MIIPILLFLIFPILENFLSFWLKDQFSQQILDLTKIFIIVAWLSGISHILITYFEGKKKIKYNTLLELYLIIPFLMVLLIVLIKFKNLIYIATILFAKEIILLLVRSQKIKNKINNIFIIYSVIIIVVINLIISLKYDTYFFYSYVVLFIYSAVIFFKKYNKRKNN